MVIKRRGRQQSHQARQMAMYCSQQLEIIR